MHVGNQYKVTYLEYDDSGLLTLDDLQVDEAWLAFEYSTSFVAPRTYGDSDEEDDEGYDTADDETHELDSGKDVTNDESKAAGSSASGERHAADTDDMDANAHTLVVGKTGVRDRSTKSDLNSEPAPAPEPETPKAIYSPTAAAEALNAFLSGIGGQPSTQASLFGRVRTCWNQFRTCVLTKFLLCICQSSRCVWSVNAGVIPVADGDEEIDEYVLEYLSGYIAECHASGEDCNTFVEVSQSASPSHYILPRSVHALI